MDTIYLGEGLAQGLKIRWQKFDVEDYEEDEMEMNYVDLPQKEEDEEEDD